MFGSICVNRTQQDRGRSRFIDEYALDARRADRRRCGGDIDNLPKAKPAVRRQQFADPRLGSSRSCAYRGNEVERQLCGRERRQRREARELLVKVFVLAGVRGRAARVVFLCRHLVHIDAGP